MSKLTIWVDVLSLILWFDDTLDGLQLAKKALVREWNDVRVPVHTSAATIAWLETQFYICRIKADKTEECVCTLAEAVRDSTT